MLQKVKSRIYEAFIWRWNIYFWHPVNRWKDKIRVKRQRNAALKIYEDIINRKPIEDIIKEFGNIRSYELKCILNRMLKVGYVRIKPLVDEPIVSVIMPHYNHQQYIGEALDALCNQTVKPDEIIIIDDMSKNFDALKDIVSKYEEYLPIKLVRATHKLYCGPAKSYGASLAKGNILIMHDADDISHPQRIETVKLFFTEYPDCVQLSNELIPFHEDFKGFAKNYNMNELKDNVLDNKPFISRHRKLFEFQLFARKTSKGVYNAGSYGPFGCSGSSGGITLRKEVFDYFSYSSQEQLRKSFTSWDDYELCTYVMLSTLAVYAIKFPLYAYRTDSSTYIGSWIKEQ